MWPWILLGDGDELLVPRSRSQDELELEEEEYRAFLEREVGEDLHNLVSVDTHEAVSASEAIDIVGDGDKKSEGKKKKKGKKEREKKKESYQGKDEVQGKKDKERDKKSKEAADQEFLMKYALLCLLRVDRMIDVSCSYILNRGWVDRSNQRVPTYNEIVESSSKKSKQKSNKSKADSDIDRDPDDDKREAQGATLSDEDSFDDLADAFETSYNFRYEEP